MKSEPSAKVHQYLLPVMTHESPSRTARHDTLATSEPALGSEIEPQPIISPLAILGKYSSFSCWLSDIDTAMALPCATIEPTDIQARENSSATRQCSIAPSPMPPYCSGNS